MSNNPNNSGRTCVTGSKCAYSHKNVYDICTYKYINIYNKIFIIYYVIVGVQMRQNHHIPSFASTWNLDQTSLRKVLPEFPGQWSHVTPEKMGPHKLQMGVMGPQYMAKSIWVTGVITTCYPRHSGTYGNWGEFGVWLVCFWCPWNFPNLRRWDWMPFWIETTWTSRRTSLMIYVW